MELMEYEKEIFIDLFTNDGLLVMARGLGIERVFLSFLKLYCEPTSLVLVLNTTPHEEEYFKHLLNGTEVSLPPRSVNADAGVTERQNIYLEGGVLFVTTRILVVDMLVERVPIGRVTGIIVNRAHKVIESCQEAFILRLYRQKNKTGFIKAFSENATAFSKGFCQIERVMKSLYLANLSLWPRFRTSVVDYYEKHKVDVVELHVHLTEMMQECQACLLDLIGGCLKEIKRCHAILDVDELSVEFSLMESFDKILRSQLDPIWHQLNQRTRQIVSDMRLLRTLLEELIQYDSVNFCNQIDAIRSSEKNFNSNVGWLFTESAERLLQNARQRIGLGKNSSSSEVELNPKWIALKEALEEVNQQAEDFATDSTKSSSSSSTSSSERVDVLVFALDEKTCRQISMYLMHPDEFASKLMQNYRSVKNFHKSLDDGPPDKKKKFQKKKSSIDTNQVNDLSAESSFPGAMLMMTSLNVVVHPIRGRDDPTDASRKLEEMQPQVIILYDAEVAAVRKIEVYRASRQNNCTLRRVYFLTYTGSTEEQKYLTALRREKDAFEGLIKQKATMVIPQEREGRSEVDDYPGQSLTNENTRKGGHNAGDNNSSQRVVVDMREFRSELPSLLHKRGITIDPVTLEVGDYILTPDICVERKSVSDLVGSLNNGRLYNQCLAMCRTYKRPVLLVEFNPNKPFALQDKFPMSNEINSNDVMSRLALLTLHFPKLRILWCQSPHATAELFEELKVDRDQPNADEAAMVTSSSEEMDDGQSKYLDKYNSTPQDMLSKMPGVNGKNIYTIMNKIGSLVELSQSSLQQLTDVMGSSSNASLLHQFLNSTPTVADPKCQEKTSITDRNPTGQNAKRGRQRFSLNKLIKK